MLEKLLLRFNLFLAKRKLKRELEDIRNMSHIIDSGKDAQRRIETISKNL